MNATYQQDAVAKGKDLTKQPLTRKQVTINLWD